jgi:hypothetical protein
MLNGSVFENCRAAVLEFGAHARCYVTVNAAHTGYLVAYALGLKDIPDAEIV